MSADKDNFLVQNKRTQDHRTQNNPKMATNAMGRPILLIFSVLLVFSTATLVSMEGNKTHEPSKDGLTIWDFTASPAPDLSEWYEVSDVVREPGMSKAVLVLQKSRLFQRAVFFSMLNPQPNGAGFAGYRTVKRTLNLEGYDSLQMRVRGQGQNSHYKIVLHHMRMNDEPNPSYEQFFEVPLKEFTTVTLPLDSFKPYYRGKEMNVTEVGALNKSQITSFGFQIFGGVYSPQKQSGTSSLEIDWVKAV